MPSFAVRMPEAVGLVVPDLLQLLDIRQENIYPQYPCAKGKKVDFAARIEPPPVIRLPKPLIDSKSIDLHTFCRHEPIPFQPVVVGYSRHPLRSQQQSCHTYL